MENLDVEKFKRDYSIIDSEFESTGLDWGKLNKIYTDFKTRVTELEEIAKLLSNQLMGIKRIHSTRFRVKDPEHLIEKIIRKKNKNKSIEININNYYEVLTDLIGIRGIHLYKEEWLPIHKQIKETMKISKDVKVNIREGDKEDYYTDKLDASEKLIIAKQKYGYRSIHYIVETKPGKTTYYAEIQIRTIFEEGWSEVDHKLRYPYKTNNKVLTQYLLILNRLAGTADEMCTFIRKLDFGLTTAQIIHKTQKTKIEELKTLLNSLDLKEEDNTKVLNILSQLKKEVDFLKNIESYDEFDILNSQDDTNLH